MSKYVFGGKGFKTKAEVIQYTRDILYSQPLTQYLTGSRLKFIDDILKNHENYKRKVGNGSYEIGVQCCEVNPANRHFYILREDGTTTDFSFHKAINPVSKESRIKEALRQAVRLQVVMFKNNYFRDNADKTGSVRCLETGLKIKRDSSNVDHFPLQFDEIVYNWFVTNRLTLEDIELEDRDDDSMLELLKDKKLESSFSKYHLKVATYRIVLDKVNQQRPRAKNMSLKQLRKESI